MFVIIVETRPETASVVYHIQYTKLFLQKNPKYNYFSDMLKSNIRYNMIFFCGYINCSIVKFWLLQIFFN